MPRIPELISVRQVAQRSPTSSKMISKQSVSEEPPKLLVLFAGAGAANMDVSDVQRRQSSDCEFI